MPKSDSKKGPWIASVPIVVSDKAASKAWYTEKLGLRVIDDEDHWVTVGPRPGATVFHLCQASENRPAPIPLEPGPSGIVLAIPGDFQSECARLKERGVAFDHEPEKAPWGWWAAVKDPDGNVLALAPAPE